MYTNVKEANPAVRILVVRLGAMGDIIHTLPAVASLKHSLPGSHITWAIAPKWAPLLDGARDRVGDEAPADEYEHD